jgi:formylglycine-generating enzyme
MKSQTLTFAVVVVATAVTCPARGDVFNMPTGQTSLQFVTVGDPGNKGEQSRLLSHGDPSYYGAVAYTYQIGKYDVTMAQYCAFLNAVAKTDTYGVFNPNMATSYYAPKLAITRSGSPGSYSYALTGSYSAAANCPTFSVTWGSAARFCNWLHNGQPVGLQGAGTTETGAYTLNGAVANADLLAITRTPGAKYFLPSESEWYKAAYYRGGSTDAGYWDYATRNNAAPSNVLSATETNNANYYDNSYTDPTNRLTPVGAFAASPGPYGTYDMSGDVWQWNEAIIGGARGLRGGDCWLSADYLTSSYRSYNSPPEEGWGTVGFRVASIPEPASLTVLLAGAACLLAYPRRRRKHCVA